MTVSDLGEHALLARLLARLPRPGAQILVGPGDDAAVIEPGRRTRLVLTTDALVERVHFSRTWSSPADIGHKALAVNLSDLAAMGAVPRWALVSLAFPADFAVDAAEALVSGLADHARAHGVSVAGGNLARSTGGLIVDVTAGGEVSSRKWLTRGGGRPGDELWVSGTLGASRAGLEMLQERPGTEGAADGEPLHRSPSPADPARPSRRRDGAGRRGARGNGRQRRPRGCGAAAGHREWVRRACGSRPRPGRARGAGVVDIPRPGSAVLAAIEGGEDYELLFAVPPRRIGRLRHVRQHVREPALTRIGTLTRAPDFVLVRDGREEGWPGGFEHFRGGDA